MQLDLQRSDCSGIYDNREHPNDRFALLMSLALYGETQLCAQPVQLVGGGGRVASRRVHAPRGRERPLQQRDYSLGREHVPDTLWEA